MLVGINAYVASSLKTTIQRPDVQRAGFVVVAILHNSKFLFVRSNKFIFRCLLFKCHHEKKERRRKKKEEHETKNIKRKEKKIS